MKNSLVILVFIFFGCKSKQFCLEENSKLSLKEGFYKEIPTGVAEGNSTFEITLVFNSFDNDKITIEGFYFRNVYIEKNFSYEDYKVKASLKLNENENESPFKLANNEIVLHYKEREKSKYVKLSLKKQENSIDNIPMEKN